MTSSRNPTDQILGVITKARAERLLTDLANAKDDDLQYVVRLHAGEIDLPKSDPHSKAQFATYWHTVKQIRDYLRRAWTATDDRRFEWYLWKALSVPTGISEWLHDEPSADATPFEAAIVHFRRNRARALLCRNKNCHAPYFFLTKKGQKFCTYECALPSLRAAKVRWWEKNRAKKGKKK